MRAGQLLKVDQHILLSGEVGDREVVACALQFGRQCIHQSAVSEPVGGAGKPLVYEHYRVGLASAESLGCCAGVVVESLGGLDDPGSRLLRGPDVRPVVEDPGHKRGR